MRKYKIGDKVIINDQFNPLRGDVVTISHVYDDGESYQVQDPGFPFMHWYFTEAELALPEDAPDVTITDNDIVSLLGGSW